MDAATERHFSGPVTVFQERRLPERATPAGYSALIGAFDLQIPLPRTLSAIGEHHRITEEGGWRIMTPRHAPHATLEGHLTFALKYEGLDLTVLKRLFLAAGAGAIETLVREKSTGAYARRIWFLYEWLTGHRLDLPNASTGRYVPVVDPEQQYVTKGENAPRYRVKNNLPGTPAFCPLVFRTEALEQFISLNLPDRARETVAGVPRDLLARTAAFLLLKDSRASYAIEGERPPQDRIQRWGRAIGEAGRQVLDRDELLRLQKIVLGDGRFIKLGFRGLFLKLAACDWIAERRNLLLTGASGLGKSWLACALGHKACRENLSVLYTRMPRLFADLAIAHGDARYARLLRSLARVKLLILDDWGPEALTPDQARDLL